MIDDPDHIIKQIMTFNKVEKLEDIIIDFKKLKLNKELKDMICQENHLKYLTNKSKDIHLIKAAINTFFNKRIIQTKADKSRNITYEISEDDIRMIEIGYKYLLRIDTSYNKDMILDTQEDLKQFNKLFDAGFEQTNDDDDIFIDTDENAGAKNETKTTKNKTKNENIQEESDYPFIDSE